MDMITLLNTVRANATAQYQDRVPAATKTNLGDIRGAMLADVDLANEFMSMIMNKVAFTIVHNKLFKNPLAILKKGNKPLGDSVEEIFVNYAKAATFDATGADLLQRKLPDVKAIYHTMNRQDKYKVTVSHAQLAKAFNSFASLEGFINGIVQSLYNGANLDEFILIKKMFDTAITTNSIKTVEVDDPVTSADNATKFIKAIKTVSANMAFPSSDYNAYLDSQTTDTVPVTTFSPIEDQYIVIDTATNVALDVDVLAKAFNIDRMTFLSKLIVVDHFPNANMRAAIVDKDWVQIYDDMMRMGTFKNEEGLYDNYILHVWQTISCSSLVNAVAFVVPT